MNDFVDDNYNVVLFDDYSWDNPTIEDDDKFFENVVNRINKRSNRIIKKLKELDVE